MKLELIRHGKKNAGYSLLPENPAEENALKVLAGGYDESETEFYCAGRSGGKSLQFVRQGYEPSDIKSLSRIGEMVFEKVKEEPKEYLVCTECGSKNVQVKAWVCPNDNNSYAGECDDDAWCEDCDEHVSLESVKVKKRKTK
jgi:Zn finger protein HypA/HybF involved in hydrogenase expression